MVMRFIRRNMPAYLSARNNETDWQASASDGVAARGFVNGRGPLADGCLAESLLSDKQANVSGRDSAESAYRSEADACQSQTNSI